MLGPAILREINQVFASRKVEISTGTSVDATIIEAPSSTKNGSGERASEVHQTQEGNEWHFGMKAHSASALVLSMSFTFPSGYRP